VKPYVVDSFSNFCMDNSEEPYVILESAILFETNSHTNFDIIIGVVAEKTIRVDRVMKRDKISIADVINKMNNQLSEMDIIRKSSFIIVNDRDTVMSSYPVLLKQVEQIDRVIRNMNHG
jgi:dephospho-CoA kinase